MYLILSDGKPSTTVVCFTGKPLPNVARIEYYQSADGLGELILRIVGVTKVSLKGKDDLLNEVLFVDGTPYDSGGTPIKNVESIYFDADAEFENCLLRINRKDNI